MIQINDKSQCCGCNACGDVCSHGAISFETDEEGFWYPKIDSSLCTNCGLCEKACPMLSDHLVPARQYEKPVCVGAIHKDIVIRFDSTSGGLFSALASAMYKQGGYVSGAVYTEQFDVVNLISNNKRDLKRLRSSKYVQSSAVGLYKTIRSLLTKGERVLACGSPCQMAALRTFLGKDYDNLLIVDFLCRACNSPLAFHQYLKSLETAYEGKIVAIKDKNKDHGWRSLARKVTFDNGKVYYGEGHEDDYRRGYHQNAFCRPSCYNCKFKGIPRLADITLGDFWGIEAVDESLDRDLGTSMVFLNNEKGERFFEGIKDKLTWKAVRLEQILPGNRPAITEGIDYPAHIDRQSLFQDLHTMPFNEVAAKHFPHSDHQRPVTTKQKIKNIIYLLRRHRSNFSWYIRNIRANVMTPQVEARFAELTFMELAPHVALSTEPGSRIIVNHHLTVGYNRNVKSKAETAIFVESGGTLVFDGPNRLLPHSDIQVFSGGRLRFGSGATNMGLKIVCAESIWIGDHTHIGRDVWIRDNNGGHVVIQKGYTNTAPIVIGNYVWICSNVQIMKGVTIGDGSIIAANSVVTSNVPPHCMVSGNPAQVVAENITWRP